jgi:hypothetical protein
MTRVVGTPETITVHIPFSVVERGGRKQVILPESARRDTPRPPIDNTMIKAIARAHRWKHLMESGRYASVTELAEAEKSTRPI